MCQTTPTRRSPPAPARLQRCGQRLVDGMELVVAGHLLDELAAAFVLEDDEVPEQFEEPRLLEHAFQQHLQFAASSPGPGPRPSMVRQGMNRSRSAVSVPMRACTPSEIDQRRVAGEQRRDLLLVGLQLIERVPDRGVLVGRRSSIR